MALIGFPTQIEIVAGSGWTSLLTPNETVILSQQGDITKYSEDGTDTPSPGNRIRLQVLSGEAKAVLHRSYSISFAPAGYARGSANDYTFLGVWNGDIAVETWYAVIASGSNYNPDVFSLMREYGAEPPAGIPWAYSRGKSQIIGGGLR